MVLGDVEEAVLTREVDEETEEEIIKVNTYRHCRFSTHAVLRVVAM
jgi:hypothetical protein